MWVAFDYNKTTLTTPGTRILVHENLKQRATWDNNGVDAWHVGPEIRVHYRCYRCTITSTGGESISDTVHLFPSKVVMPALSSQDKATDAIRNIITILRNPVPSTSFL